MTQSVAALAVAALMTAFASAQADPVSLPTRAEASSWRETSSYADVLAHLEAVRQLEPAGRRLTNSTFGSTTLGKPLPLVAISLGEGTDRLRCLVIANIHAGEVEGKEVLQILLREIAQGQHEAILKYADLWFVPVFNADGNDAIRRENRVSQNGPERGVGERANGQGLDLNRDFLKLETPEVRALVGVFDRVDPHLFMDLHTTNGSHHGYHLTYAPSLSTNVDVALADFTRQELLPAIRARVASRHSFRVFDYGNFRRGAGGRGQDPTKGWWTYDHAPRFGTNYFGLRNRVAILSEAYSYLPFEQRVAVTKAFVLETLRAAVEQRVAIAKLCAAADASVLAEAPADRAVLRFDTDYAKPELGEVLVGSAEAVEVEGVGRRYVASAEFSPVDTEIARRFESKQAVAHPGAAWAVVGVDESVAQLLLRHGLEVLRLESEFVGDVEEFRVAELSRNRRRFQGHELVKLGGDLRRARRVLPVGTLIVPSRQRLARVAAQLLEGHSEDSLATWNGFDGLIRRSADAGDELCFPVLRIPGDFAGLDVSAPLLAAAATRAAEAPLLPRPDGAKPGVVVRVVCDEPGRRVISDAFESEVVWEGRQVHYEVGQTSSTDVLEVARLAAAAVQSEGQSSEMVLIEAAEAVHHGEILDLGRAIVAAGAESVFFEPRRR